MTKQIKKMSASEDQQPRGRKQIVMGRVVSDKMQKTISVKIFRLVQHSTYGKFIKKSSVFKAHDEKNEAKIGDTVRICSCRPLSKTKRWKLIEIVQRGTAPASEVNI